MEDHGHSPAKPDRPFDPFLRQGRRVQVHGDNPNAPFELAQPALEEDRQGAGLAVVGEDQVTDLDGGRQHLAVPADGEEGLGGHTHIVANEPLQTAIDVPLGPAR